ncbi:MAG: DUF1513 domain-containing protein [Rhodocyclaceae bacterium]|nr:DUF1513 domain-containing protein [Rhodocyclaceae bacterium]
MIMRRRDFLQAAIAGAALAGLPRLAPAATPPRRAIVGAAWRGPKPTDPYFAGALEADWETRSLTIRYAVPLPTRPHGLIAEEDGGLTILAVRPGAWLLRCDGAGKIVRQVRLEDEGETRLGGHAIVAADGKRLFATGTDFKTGQGRLLVRERESLKKLDEWATHGIDPHQLLTDGTGHLLVANGGVPRTHEDRKVDLERMDSSLVRIDAENGRLLGQWRLDDRRLSMRHLAWNRDPREDGALLGIAMQAEHAEAQKRAAAPVLAVFDGERLIVPTTANDGVGYCGDIAPAHRGGFVVSSNQSGQALLWHPGIPEKLQPVVKMQEAYALAPWHGPGRGGGVLVATAWGLGRWHPEAPPLLLPWPQPMALDNHWVSWPSV